MRVQFLSHVAIAAALAAGVAFPPAGTTPDERTRVATDDAATRAEGNRLATALRIGLVLFRTQWPAQVLHVRVDGEGDHEIAGVRISAVKFHQRLDLATFDREIAAIVRQTFDASEIEEVDVQAETPIRVGEGAIVSGDLAVPSQRIVYSVTVRRDGSGALAARLRAGRGVYVDPAFRRVLGCHAAAGGPEPAAIGTRRPVAGIVPNAADPVDAGVRRIPPAR